MKKLAALLILSAITFSSISCGSKGDDIVTPDQKPNPEPTPELTTKELIFKHLSDLKNGNFTLSYEISSVKYEDVVTSKYYYVSYLNLGAILLNTYGENTYSYDFEIANNKVNIKGQSFNEEYTSQKVTDLNKGNALRNLPEFTSTNVLNSEQNIDSEFIISDENIINIFSAQLDFYGIKRIKISLNSDKDLVLEFQDYDKEIDDYYTIDAGGKVTVKNIGNSKIDIVENYINSFKKPAENLFNKANNLFNNVSFVSTISDVTLAGGGNLTALEVKKTNLDIYNNYVSIEDFEDGTKTSSLTYKRVDETGTLKKVGVNAKNELIEEETTKNYSEFGFVSKNDFELDKFVKLYDTDTSYTYVGEDASRLAYSITQDSKIYSWKCQEIKVTLDESGNVSEMNFFTGILLDKDKNEYFYRWINTKVLKEPNIIEENTKKSPSKDDKAIRDMLNKIKNDDSTFIAKTIDAAWGGTRETYFIKGLNYILKPTYVISGENKTFEKSEYEGFYQKDGTIYKFNYKEDNTVQLIGEPIKDKTLKDFINFDISSEVLFKKDENTLATYNDIINIGSTIGFSLNPLTIDPSTFEMKISDNKISNITYSYGLSNEEISFSYESTAINETLKANLEKAIKDSAGETGTFKTWDQVSSSFSKNSYKGLVEHYGEEFAKKVPYYPVADATKFNNDFDGDYDDFTDESNPFFVIYFASSYDAAYVEGYKNYIKSFEFTSSDDKTFFNSDNTLKIVIVGNGEDENYSTAFLHIYKL